MQLAMEEPVIGYKASVVHIGFRHQPWICELNDVEKITSVHLFADVEDKWERV